MTRIRLLSCGLVLAVLALTACGPAATPTSEPTLARPLRPTFTPSPIPTATSVPTVTPLPTDTPLPPDTPTPAPPTALVLGDGQVNVRNGPGAAYPEIGQVATGAELPITASNAAGDWYQVCCVNDQPVWIVGRLVEVRGDAAAIQTAQSIPAPPTATRAPTRPPVVQPPAPAQPTATSAPQQPSLAFDKLSTETRSNTNVIVTFFGLAWQSDLKNPVQNDYKLVVEGPAGRGETVLGELQWGDAGLPGQFQYNAKVEFIGGPAGVYRAYLIDSAGKTASEAWEYTVTGDQRTFLPRWKKG